MSFMARTLGYGGAAPIVNYMWSAAITPTDTKYLVNPAAPVRTPSGDFIMAGTVTGGPSSTNALYYCVYKINGVTGAKRWSKKISFSFNGPDIYNPVTTCSDSSDNVFVAYSSTLNTTSKPVIIQKFDATTGAAVTSTSYAITGYGGVSAIKMASDSSGNIYVCSMHGSTINYNNNTITLVKYDNSLNVLWQKNYGDHSSSVAGGLTDIAVDSSGNVYIALYNSNGILKIDSSGTFVKGIYYSDSYTTNRFALAISGDKIYVSLSFPAYINIAPRIGVLDTSLNLLDSYYLLNFTDAIVTPGAASGNVLISSFSRTFKLGTIAELNSSRGVVRGNSYYAPLGAAVDDYGYNTKATAAIRSTTNEYLIHLPYQSPYLNAYRGSNAFFLVPVSYFNNVSLSEANATAGSWGAGTPGTASSSASISTYTPSQPTYNIIGSSNYSVISTDTTFSYSYHTYDYLKTYNSYTYASPGSYTWYPAGVTKAVAVAIGGGGGGWWSGGGGGGGLAYYNSLNVPNPNGSYTVVVGAGGAGGTTNSTSGGNSYIYFPCASPGFCQVPRACGGGGYSLNYGQGGNGGNSTGTSGYNGGNGNVGGGGGAGGYTGNGGAGGRPGNDSSGDGGGGGVGGCYYSYCYCCYNYSGCTGGSSGGGVGVVNSGSTGYGGCGYFGGFGGSGGTMAYSIFNQAYGAGGGSGGNCTGPCGTTLYTGGSGTGGAVRILWPWLYRAYPDATTKDMTS